MSDTTSTASWPEILTRNVNMVWAATLVRELLALGVDHFYVSPGYRDAPLIAALTYTPGTQAFSCMDERAAAYRALGYAKATGKPAVVLCTSGTAGANYYPAVIEAYKDQIPLLVVTADRPFELVHAGANQVIPQSHLYHGFTRGAFAWPEPSEAIALAALQQHVRHAWRATQGCRPGPVHINMPFREPLEPRTPRGSAAVSAAYLASGRTSAPPALATMRTLPNPEAVAALAARMERAERGLMIIGRLDAWRPTAPIVRLAQAWGWPVYADPASGVRGALGTLAIEDAELPAMRAALSAYAPDVVVHVGKRLVSKWFDQVLAQRRQGYYGVLSALDDMQDETFTHDERWDGEPDALSEALLEALPLRMIPPAFPPAMRSLRLVVDQKLAALPFSFLRIAALLDQQASEGTCILVGNSTAIRAMNLAARGEGKGRIIATRGVSGIEGHVATTLGLAEGSQGPAICLLGDVSLVHDLNSLLFLKTAARPVLVLVVNNGGGGIFYRLPLQAFPEVMSPFITTPHAIRFKAAAELAGIPYAEVTDERALSHALADFTAAPRSMLIECRLEQVADDAAFDALVSLTAGL